MVEESGTFNNKIESKAGPISHEWASSLSYVQIRRIIRKLYKRAKDYDEEYREYVKDIDDWKKLVKKVGAKKVLELGVGTGRIAIPLARMGVSIVGLDISPQMVSLLRRKVEKINDNPHKSGGHVRVNGMMQDFSSFYLAQTDFDMAIIPLNTFFHLPPEKKITCIEHTSDHLKKGGLIAINVFNVEEMIRKHKFTDGNRAFQIQTVNHQTKDKRYILQRFDSDRYDRTNQVLHCDRIVKWTKNASNVPNKEPWQKRFLLFIATSSEMKTLLSSNNLMLDSQLCRTGLREESHWWVARKY